MPGPYGTSLLDDFNRADADPLGGGWTVRGGGASIQIVSNQLESGNSPPASGSAYYGGLTLHPDMELWVTPVNLPSGDVIGLHLRRLTTNENHYEVTWNGGDLNIGRRDDGVWTLLNQATSISWQAGDVFAASIRGSSLAGWRYRSGVWERIVEATDSTYYQGGHPSMGFYSAANALQWDDLGGGGIPRGSIGLTGGLISRGAR